MWISIVNCIQLWGQGSKPAERQHVESPARTVFCKDLAKANGSGKATLLRIINETQTVCRCSGIAVKHDAKICEAYHASLDRLTSEAHNVLKELSANLHSVQCLHQMAPQPCAMRQAFQGQDGMDVYDVLVTNGSTLAMTLAEDGCHSCSSRGSWNKHSLFTSQKLVGCLIQNDAT